MAGPFREMKDSSGKSKGEFSEIRETVPRFIVTAFEGTKLFHNLHHAHSVQPTVFFQMLAHAVEFGGGNLAMGDAQEFAAGRAALLNRQIFVALAGQGGQHGFH